jgi:hypothetical protein
LPDTSPGGACAPRKWYFCVNEAGLDRTFPLIRAAVVSAGLNTRLQPVCLYNGSDDAHAKRIAGLGVEVLRHRSSLEPELRAAYSEHYDQFSGHWLRVDLPLIEQDEEVVLYTDIDVMFLRHPTLSARPATLAAAPEFDRANLGYFSSGVLFLNLPRLRELQGAFSDAIRRRLAGDFRYPAHDQTSFNDFFGPSPENRAAGRAFTPMDPGLNWKPFWGLNPQASIVHFHGPKPRHARKMLESAEHPAPPKFRELLAQSPEAYAHYVPIWEAFEKRRTPAEEARAAKRARMAERAQREGSGAAD